MDIKLLTEWARANRCVRSVTTTDVEEHNCCQGCFADGSFELSKPPETMIECLTNWIQAKTKAEEEEKARNALFLKYENELNECYEKWQKAPGFLPEGKYAKYIATIVENSRLFSAHPGVGLDDKVPESCKFVRDIYTDFYPFQMVSIQPLFGPTGHVFYYKFRYKKSPLDSGPEINLVRESEEICAKTRKMKTWLMEDTKQMGRDIKTEITREIITDLKNNAGTVAKKMILKGNGKFEDLDYETVYMTICEISGVIHRKTLRGGAKWLFMHPDMADKFPIKKYDHTSKEVIQYLGISNGVWKVFADPGFPKETIVIGYRGDANGDAGYIYSPYIPVSVTPRILEKDTTTANYGLLHRYGKKLTQEGAKFYARVTFEEATDEEPQTTKD